MTEKSIIKEFNNTPIPAIVEYVEGYEQRYTEAVLKNIYEPRMRKQKGGCKAETA